MNHHTFPLVSINLVVLNGEKYIRECLWAVRAQTYQNCEVVVFDNNSTDKTKEIVKREFPEYILIENNKNYGTGPGWNRCLARIKGQQGLAAQYMLGLCVDVVLDKDFVKHAVAAMERDERIGALQAKIYRMQGGVFTNIIDTTGFEIFKSRRIVNRGHGAKDIGQYDTAGEVFSYEGAAPFWRVSAMVDSEVEGQFHDEDYFWYADDIDAGWRMRLRGWKSWYAPSVIAYHDRSTTKRTSGGYLDFIHMRKTIPARKRLLDWQNTHFTFLKNDFFLSALKDMPRFLAREFAFLVYLFFFEQNTLRALPRMIRLFPRMLKKRAYIMKRVKTTRREMEKWFL